MGTDLLYIYYIGTYGKYYILYNINYKVTLIFSTKPSFLLF